MTEALGSNTNDKTPTNIRNSSIVVGTRRPFSSLWDATEDEIEEPEDACKEHEC